jgi:hypothetical protein
MGFKRLPVQKTIESVAPNQNRTRFLFEQWSDLRLKPCAALSPAEPEVSI